MGKIKQINMKNQTYYFYNDQINFKNFDASSSKLGKKDYKEIDIYYIGYKTFKEIANCNSINSVNPLYLMIDEMIGQFEDLSFVKAVNLTLSYFQMMHFMNYKNATIRKNWCFRRNWCK